MKAILSQHSLDQAPASCPLLLILVKTRKKCACADDSAWAMLADQAAGGA